MTSRPDFRLEPLARHRICWRWTSLRPCHTRRARDPWGTSLVSHTVTKLDTETLIYIYDEQVKLRWKFTVTYFWQRISANELFILDRNTNQKQEAWKVKISPYTSDLILKTTDYHYIYRYTPPINRIPLVKITLKRPKNASAKKPAKAGKI